MPALIIYPLFVIFIYYIIFKRSENEKIKIKLYYFALVTIAFFLQAFSMFLIYQDAIYADEKGVDGNIFGNVTANILLIISFLIIVATLVGLFKLKSLRK
jgi:ABC-type Fe3+-siderophore transport system permease subunit